MQKTDKNLFFQSDESGFVLVASLLILMILVVIGFAATNTATIEIQIAGNEKVHKMAFYNGDSGIFTAPKVISQAIEDDADPAVAPDITLFGLPGVPPAPPPTYTPDYTVGSGRFFGEIMGFVDDGGIAGIDMQFALGGFNVDVDIDHAGTKPLPGGAGAEFASGSSGIGAGSTGGYEIRYDLNSTGYGPANAQSQILARYRKIPGTAGGL
ncbi:MAG: hypothetical protein U9R60_05180 [Bacteroidota bacterium]|nr:hypothetical protein [Bacteroidota bacterium]